MKTKFYLISMCTAFLCTGSAYANICPQIPQGWKGDPIGRWRLNTEKYGAKLKEKNEGAEKDKPYRFLNAWLYYPGSSKLAVCHYVYGDYTINQLSLVTDGMNTCNTHFGSGVKEGSTGEGMHCLLGSAGACAFLPGGYPKEGKNASCP